ncbi:hypothetical protein K7432_000104 [Basidiobolus ranarum]|uniref:Uncharacterized protein n=1 Tax=Basidiobolus ranarum TaxID=34480 RepID=A0ABR2X4Z3_9FUNG
MGLELETIKESLTHTSSSIFCSIHYTSTMSARIAAFTTLAKVSGLVTLKRVAMRTAPMATVRSRNLTNLFTVPMEENERAAFERAENEYMRGVLNADDVEWNHQAMYTLNQNMEVNPMIDHAEAPVDDLWDDLMNEN